jgi:hypothetical protein
MDGQAHGGGGDKETSRSPDKDDLSRICAELNRLGAKYIVVGGFAVIQSGYARLTNDIDILIDPALENEAAVFEALRILPDKAVDQLDPGDVAKYTVVRIADDVLVDVMASACGVDYHTALNDVEFHDVNGVRIPFASPRTLLKMKQTGRAKDIPDILFLQKWLADESQQNAPEQAGILESLRRVFKGKASD